MIPIYDKMSMFTVFKRIAKDRDLEKLYNKMKLQNIDMVKFDTVVKSGNQYMIKPYMNGELNQDISNEDVKLYTYR